MISETARSGRRGRAGRGRQGQSPARGDFAVLNDVFAEDLVWHEGGRNQISGDYHGREAVFGFFGKTMEVTQGSLHLDLHAVLADDEHGAALVDVTASRAAGPLRSMPWTLCICATARWWKSGLSLPIVDGS